MVRTIMLNGSRLLTEVLVFPSAVTATEHIRVSKRNGAPYWGGVPSLYRILGLDRGAHIFGNHHMYLWHTIETIRRAIRHSADP